MSKYGRSIIALVLGVSTIVVPAAAARAATGDSLPSCSTPGLEKQLNNRAFQALAACGRAKGGSPGVGGNSSVAAPSAPGQAQVGSGNTDVITGAEIFAHVTQSEDQVWVSGATAVIAYNDSAGATSNYSGISVSADRGATYTRLLPSPFASGHGNNYGDPGIVYNNKLGKWVSVWLSSGCGGQGLGTWTSTNATTWSTGPCAFSGSQGDRESMWVDNTASSPFYGRMYISYNNFNVGGGALYVTHSDDAATWTAPVQLSGGFIRDVQIGVAPNGTVLLMAMDEGTGGLSPRQNYVYRSTNGGVSFLAPVSMGAAFPAAGDGTSGYFAYVTPIWRQMGWGDLATGSANTVVYSYAAAGAGGDTGDIYIVRSTDNGATWSAPLRIDGDSTGNTQWMPSTAGGGSNFLVSWYDRRHQTTTNSYERWGVTSTDGGLHWSSPQRISDITIPQPEQPDSNVQAIYAGDYMRDYYDGVTFYDAWTDGRNAISGHPQQDVETERFTPADFGQDYKVETDGTAVPIIPATTDIGNHCDDCSTPIALPFPVTLYGVSYDSANMVSNGYIQFDTTPTSAFNNEALPSNNLGAVIAPFWDDLKTNASGDGIYTVVNGSAPNRTFVVEWRTHKFSGGAVANFEVVFAESSSTYRVIYGSTDTGTSATVGVQGGPTGPYSQLSMNTGSLAAGLQHEYLIPTTPSPVGGAHILLAYADNGGSSRPSASGRTGAPAVLPGTLRGQILALPGVASVDVYDVQASTPSRALLAGYQVVVPMTNYAPADGVALGNVLADYEQFDQGVVVAPNFDTYGPPFGISGRWISGGYSAFNETGSSAFSDATLGTFTTTHPLMAGVSSLGAFFRMNATLASGASLVASWSDGKPAIATKVNNVNAPGNGKRTVGINAYLGNTSQNFSGDFAKVIMNAAHWLSPSLDTVAPTSRAIVTPTAVFQKDKRFPVSWTALDPGSGIASYDVQTRSVGLTGSFTAWTPLLTGTTATSMTFTGTPGSTVCFKVLARDFAGNASIFSSQRCTAVPLDDPALTPGGSWGTVSNGYYYGGTTSKSTTNGSTLTLASVTTKQIAVLVTKCPGCGEIQVFHAGVLRGTFSLASDFTAYRQLVSVVLPGVTTGQFQIVVSSATGPIVEVDGVDFSAL